MAKPPLRQIQSSNDRARAFADDQGAEDPSQDGVQRVLDYPTARAARTRLSLSATERADLERLARHGSGLARRARLILARAEGETLSRIAGYHHVHTDTVRRWLRRFEQRGLAGLRHGNLGKSRNLIFDAPLRAEICRRASMDPFQLGERFPIWSLIKLRNHLIRHGVVRTISHEALRQVLLAGSPSRRYWRGGNGVAELK